MKHCSKCDLTFPDLSTFCKKCGGPLSDDEVTIQAAAGRSGSLELTCQNCGKPYRPSTAFCKGCGKPLGTQKADYAEHATGQIGDRGTVPPITVSTIPQPTIQASPAGQPASDEQSVKCGQCGTLNQGGMSFCKSCRAPIGSHAKKVKARKLIAGAVAGLAVFATLVALVTWYLWGVKVTIESDPGASKVAIDGKEVGTTNTFGVLTVPHNRAGEHSLVVMHDGCDDWKQTFNIAFTDFSKSLKIKLNLTKYKVTVVSSPAGSEVLVDGQSMGNTSDSGGTLETSPLTPGEHSVLVRHDGYRDWKQTVKVNGNTKLDVTLSSAPVYDPGSSSADSEIRNTLEGWAQSTRNRDVDSHLRYYSDTLDYYYNRTLVPSSKVREDRMRAFAKFNYLSVQLNNMNVQLDSTGQRATVVFDKTFDFRGDNNAFYNGSVQDQLTLTKLGGAWLITGEKEDHQRH